MMRVLRTATLLACSLMSLATSQGTVKPANTDNVELLTPAPTAYVFAPIPEATENSPSFRKVPNVVCSDEVSKLVSTIYDKNQQLFDVCAQASEYQIFPFSGKLPTPQQIYTLATTKACTALFTACVLANLPQCDISQLGLKAVTETLLKITVDVDNGKPAPDTTQFHNTHIWRRDVNLAQAAGVPFGNDSQLYTEFTANLWTALTKYNVQVKPDLSIVYDEAELMTTMNGTLLTPKSDAGPYRAQPLSESSAASSDMSSVDDGSDDGDDDVQMPSGNANVDANATPPPVSASAAHGVSVGVVVATWVAMVIAVVAPLC